MTAKQLTGLQAPDSSQYVTLTDGAGNLLTAGSGTVTSVSVTTANGVSGSVATATTTPAITLTLGAITPTTVNKVTITPPATSATLTVADGKVATHSATTTFAGTDGKTLTISNSGTLSGGDAFVLSIAAAKTLTVSNTLTLAGTDATTMTFPTTSATLARTDAANTFTGHQTIEGVTSTGATGTGKFVFDTAPTLGAITATSIAFSPTTGGIIGTGTNDSAAAGKVGECITSITSNTSATVTITNASPGVVSWTAHGLNIGSGINFTTTGGLPTGLSVGTNYFVCSTSFGANSFTVATTVANALAGTPVNTSSAGSGTHTAVGTILVSSGTELNITGISLTAGDWDVHGVINYKPAATTNVTSYIGSVSNTSGASDPAPGRLYVFQNSGGFVPGASSTLSTVVPDYRISLSGTTTIHLVGASNFSVSTLVSYGIISARRVR